MKIEKKKSLLLNKRGTFDVDNAANVVSGIMFVAILLAVLILVVVMIFGLSIFQNSSINVTINAMQTSILGMVTNFFALMPTIGTILAVVILIAGIVLLVIYVRRMKDTGTSAPAFQG